MAKLPVEINGCAIVDKVMATVTVDTNHHNRFDFFSTEEEAKEEMATWDEEVVKDLAVVPARLSLFIDPADLRQILIEARCAVGRLHEALDELAKTRLLIKNEEELRRQCASFEEAAHDLVCEEERG